MKQFSCKTKLISGAGSITQLKTLNSHRLLLITDPYFAQNGVAQKVLSCSGAAQTRTFDRVQPDPTVELAAEATAVAKEFQPDTLVALGGGSAMDLTKAVSRFFGGTVQLVMIPTTSGSGSEVTDFAVLTHGNTKYPLVDGSLRPDMAILDSDLLTSLPKSLIADAGFDVLGHAIEAFIATDATVFSDALAKEAFSVVFSRLPASFAGDTEARLPIHQAATMAGLAFTHAGLGLCHALAHSLGAAYHIPHGRLIAMLLPAVMDCNAHVCGKKYAILARAVGLPGSAESVAVRSLKTALVGLRRQLRMPQNLKEAGVDPYQVWQNAPDIVKTALADPCCRTNPLPVADFMVRRILEAVTGRG